MYLHRQVTKRAPLGVGSYPGFSKRLHSALKVHFSRTRATQVGVRSDPEDVPEELVQEEFLQNCLDVYLLVK